MKYYASYFSGDWEEIGVLEYGRLIRLMKVWPEWAGDFHARVVRVDAV